MTNILHISPDFNYACGVSRYVYLLLEHYNSRPGYKVHFMTNGGNALDRLNKLNIKPKIMEFSKGLKNIVYYNDNLAELNDFCESNKIDIIHSHHRYPEMIASKIPYKVKTVSTCHSFVQGFKKLSFKSDLLIAVSKAVKSHLIQHFNIPEYKIKVLHNFVPQPQIDENDICSLKNALGLNNKHFVIFFAGRSSKIKGLKYLIEGFNLLKEEYNSAVLIIVAPQDNNLSEVINENPYRIIRLDPVNNIFPLMSLSNVVVLPSLRDPFPYLMLEAGILKKTFIGSRVDGIAEFIDNGINGLLFNPEESSEIYFQLKRTIENKLLCEKMSANLFEKVNSLTPELYFSKLDTLYQKLLNE